jgi:hypothetical protein
MKRWSFKGRAMDESHRLRKLAAWYREFAERAGEPWVWEARRRRAVELEEEAALLEEKTSQIFNLSDRSGD